MKDIDYNADLPLHQPWQRAATRELAELLHLVCCGEFDDVQQLSDRLSLSAEGLRQMYASPNLQPDNGWDTARFHRLLHPVKPQLPPLPADSETWDFPA